MNRADLAWALKAVLPHATGKPGIVGAEELDGVTYLYATDRYTIGVARVNEGTDWDWRMTAKEATELMRFVRPDRVPERTQEIVYATQPQELHIGFDAGEASEALVFETVNSELELDHVLGLIEYVNEAEPEWDELIYQPKLFERFAQAQRDLRERLRVIPRHTSDKFGAAVVTVGADFIGMIAGLTYDDEGPATVEDFLGGMAA